MGMASQIMPPPFKDAVIKEQPKSLFSDTWAKWTSLLSDVVGNYFVSARDANGRSFPLFFVPSLTTTQRNALQNVQNGAVIYNVTVHKFQGYANGTWVDFH